MQCVAWGGQVCGSPLTTDEDLFADCIHTDFWLWVCRYICSIVQGWWTY